MCLFSPWWFLGVWHPYFFTSYLGMLLHCFRSHGYHTKASKYRKVPNNTIKRDTKNTAQQNKHAKKHTKRYAKNTQQIAKTSKENLSC